MNDHEPYGIDAFELLPPIGAKPRREHTSSTDDVLTEAIERLGLVVGDGVDGGYDITCPWEAEHSTPSAPSATTYWPARGDKPGFKCQHAHCARRTVKDLIAELRRRDRALDEHFKAQRKPEANGHASEPPPPDSEEAYGQQQQAPPPGKSAGFQLRNHSAARWIGKTPKLHPMVVASMVPSRAVTLLVADGGVGKSIIAQTLATCVASDDTPFLGQVTEHKPAVFITGEDDEDILHSRQERICDALGIPLESLADRLIVRSVSDEEMALFSEGRTTRHLDLLDEELMDVRPGLAAIDSASLFYDDEEIHRRMVAKFMRALNRLSSRVECAIPLLAHTSRSSDNSVARLASGNTGWVWQARAAIRMATISGDGQEEDDSTNANGVRLSVRKSNYCKPGLTVDLEWTDTGVLVPKEAASGILKSLEDKRDDELLLAEITARWIDPDAEPLSKAANMKERHFPRFMARKHRWTVKRSEAAMIRLSDAVKITAGEVRKGGKKTSGLRPVSHEN